MPMTAIIAFLLSNPVVLAIVGGIVAAVGAWLKGRSAGVAAERGRQAEAEANARDVSDQVQNDVGALPPDAARKELDRWSKS